MDLLGNIKPTQDALQIQQLRLQVIAENIAHAQTTRTAQGGPYQRRELVFSSYLDPKAKSDIEGASLPRLRLDSVAKDPTPGDRIHQPGHPDADENGYVTYPNVAVSMEMVDLMQAARAYEANLQVVRTSKEMAEKAMTIGG